MFWNWINDHYQIIQWIGIASILFFFLSIFIMHFVITKLPHDYFLDNISHSSKNHKNLLFRVVKNLSGLLLAISGIILLFIPGQGLLTIALGLCLIDIPCIEIIKKRFILSALVKKTLNWVRLKKDLPEFNFPPRN